MSRLVAAPLILTLAACATGPVAPPVTAFTGTETGTDPAAAVAATAEETVDIEELDNGLVCKYEKRPGSRIAEEYCYTREERAANQEAQDALVRQQMNTLSMDQEARMQRERELGRSRGGVLTY